MESAPDRDPLAISDEDVPDVPEDDKSDDEDEIVFVAAVPAKSAGPKKRKAGSSRALLNRNRSGSSGCARTSFAASLKDSDKTYKGVRNVAKADPKVGNSPNLNNNYKSSIDQDASSVHDDINITDETEFHDLIKRLRCPWCRAEFDSLRRLSRHAVDAHGVEDPKNCPEVEELRRSVGRVVCLVCSKTVTADVVAVREHFGGQHDIGDSELRERPGKFMKRHVEKENARDVKTLVESGDEEEGQGDAQIKIGNCYTLAESGQDDDENVRKLRFDELVKQQSCPWCGDKFLSLARVARHARASHDLDADAIRARLDEVRAGLDRLRCLVCGGALAADCEVVCQHFRRAHDVYAKDLRDDPGKYVEALADDGRAENTENVQTDKSSKGQKSLLAKNKAGNVQTDKRSKGQKSLLSKNNVNKRRKVVKFDDVVKKPRCPWCRQEFRGFLGLVRHAKEEHAVRNASYNAALEAVKRGMLNVSCVVCRKLLKADYDILSIHFRTAHDVPVAEVAEHPEAFIREAEDDVEETNEVPEEADLPTPARDTTVHTNVVREEVRNLTSPQIKQEVGSPQDEKIECLDVESDETGPSKVETNADQREDDASNEAEEDSERPSQKRKTSDESSNDEAKKQRLEPESSKVKLQKLTCPWCPKSEGSWKQLKEHTMSMHNRSDEDPKMKEIYKSIGKVSCKKCGKTFNALVLSAVNHFKQAHKMKASDVMGNVDEHLRVAKETNDKEVSDEVVSFKWAKFKCPFCKETFARSPALKKHAVSKHGKTSDDAKVLQVIDQIPTAKCKLCGSRVRTSYIATYRHFHEKHDTPVADVVKDADEYLDFAASDDEDDDDEPAEGSAETGPVLKLLKLDCPWCSESFSRPNILRRHGQSVHGVEPDDYAIGQAIEQMPFGSCRICQGRVRMSYYATYHHFHMRHSLQIGEVMKDLSKYLSLVVEDETGETNSKVPESKKMKVQENNLNFAKVHETKKKINMKEENSFTFARFKCPWCDESFAMLKSLKNHADRSHGKSANDPEILNVWKAIPKASCKLCKTRVSTAVYAIYKHFQPRHSVSTQDVKKNADRYLDFSGAAGNAKKGDFEWPRFKCPWCDEDFRAFPKLKLHASDKHEKEQNDKALLKAKKAMPRARCKICSRLLKSSYSTISGHLAAHKIRMAEFNRDPDKVFEFGDMKKKRTREVSSKVISPVPANVYRFTCPWCDYPSSTHWSRICAHAKACHDKEQDDELMRKEWNSVPNQRCNLCQKVVRGTYDGIRTHFKEHHKGEEISQTTRSSEEVPKSPQSKIRTDIPTNCHRSERQKTPLATKLEQLLRKCHRFQCPWCSMQTAHWYSMCSHAQRAHSKSKEDPQLRELLKNVRKVRCNVCSVSIRGTHHGLAKHFAAFHKTKNAKQTTTVGSPIAEKVEVGQRSKVEVRKRSPANAKFNPKSRRRGAVMPSNCHAFKCPWCEYHTVHWKLICNHSKSMHGKQKEDPEIRGLLDLVGRQQCDLCSKVMRGTYDVIRDHFKICHPGENISQTTKTEDLNSNPKESVTRGVTIPKESVTRDVIIPKKSVTRGATIPANCHWFHCPWCDIKTAYSYNIIQHANKVHQKAKDDPDLTALQKAVRTQQCNLCHAKIRGTVERLRDHFRTVHKTKDIDQTTPVTDDGKTEAPRKVPGRNNSIKANINSSPLGFRTQCLKCDARFTKMRLLRTHCEAEHPKWPSDVLANRSLENGGLIRCQECGVLLENSYSMVDNHVRNHKLTLDSYAKKFGRDAEHIPKLLQSATKIAVQCPTCKEEIVGSRSLHDHLVSKHGSKMRMNHVVQTIAKQLSIPYQIRPSDMTAEEKEREMEELNTEAWEEPLLEEEEEALLEEEEEEDGEAEFVLPVITSVTGSGVGSASLPVGSASLPALEWHAPEADDDKPLIPARHKETNNLGQASATVRAGGEVIDHVTNENNDNSRLSNHSDENDAVAQLTETSSSSKRPRFNVKQEATEPPRESIPAIDRRPPERETPNTAIVKREVTGADDISDDEEVWEFSDGCRYRCPKCGQAGPVFHSLDGVKRHIRRRHGRNPSLLLGLKSARVEEAWISCKICNRNVVHDRIELASHAWSEHGLDLEAYGLV